MKKKLLFWRKFFFFRILVPANVQYVCNEPAKRQISSTNTVRWVDFTVHALLSRQSNFSRRTKGINRKGMSPYTLIFLYSNTSSVSRFMQKYEKKIPSIFHQDKKQKPKYLCKKKNEITLKKLTHKSLFVSNGNISSIPTFMQNKKR